MSLTETTQTNPEPTQVIFYEGRDFQGKAYLSTLGSKVDIYREYRPLNDKLNSVKVGRSCKVLAYYAAGFGKPEKEFIVDTPDIDIRGMSSFIVLSKDGEHAILFTFSDSTGEGRTMTLQSAGFGSVTQPNPQPEEGIDPNNPRVFATLKVTDIESTPVVTAIFVRKTSGEYEDPNGALHFYWKDGKPHAKNIPDYGSANLTYTQDGNVFKFVWR
ncbi:beta/gamma crystallin domain-containing protein [Paraherbaspirillum soli]|uniref:Beta/gamma crystallin domain-containing protein n=1 Tax=Paraherbaspirillum soli TaxID=631222 RepID=A0ABW0MFE9_9BURK